ncbi:MAG: hypothetical protein JO171_00415 [Paludibacterium sp.]|uniref:hypothetical protein n=1 Tax=Paludibacterium sp. TaxID=1917523 RepID=UPI0025FB3A60|nr:hypothetical protein [Paludibacterium sp.]MBV8045587.1 hypothetical protein [Paludibacterium sp.]MBV8647589.1 hypothetical protein [Paludibacterium sp.]
MYRLKLISNTFGIDDKSPIYPTADAARAAANVMLRLYRGKVKVEIYQVLDLRTNQKRVIETIGSPE